MVWNKYDYWKKSSWIRIGAGGVFVQSRNEFSGYVNIRSLTSFKNSSFIISGSSKTRLSDWLVLNIGALRLLERQKLLSQTKSFKSQKAWLYIKSAVQTHISFVCQINWTLSHITPTSIPLHMKQKSNYIHFKTNR